LQIAKPWSIRQAGLSCQELLKPLPIMAELPQAQIRWVFRRVLKFSLSNLPGVVPTDLERPAIDQLDVFGYAFEYLSQVFYGTWMLVCSTILTRILQLVVKFSVWQSWKTTILNGPVPRMRRIRSE
jgi:hypothetical protein